MGHHLNDLEEIPIGHAFKAPVTLMGLVAFSHQVKGVRLWKEKASALIPKRDNSNSVANPEVMRQRFMRIVVQTNRFADEDVFSVEGLVPVLEVLNNELAAKLVEMGWYTIAEPEERNVRRDPEGRNATCHTHIYVYNRHV